MTENFQDWSRRIFFTGLFLGFGLAFVSIKMGLSVVCACTVLALGFAIFRRKV